MLEGNAHALRDVVEAIAAAGPRLLARSCASPAGPARRSSAMRADATGLPVTWSEDVETTARGAAMLAAAGSGLHASTAAAAQAMARESLQVHEPDPAGGEASRTATGATG